VDETAATIALDVWIQAAVERVASVSDSLSEIGVSSTVAAMMPAATRQPAQMPKARW
jgi:hypothetical protein